MNDFCFDTYHKMLEIHQQPRWAFDNPIMDSDLFLLLQRIYIYLSYRKETSSLQQDVCFFNPVLSVGGPTFELGE